MTLPQSMTLRTKLRPPRLADDVVVRKRLLKRLSYADALTLVVAPAGYGKTTLATTWMAQAPWPGAWLTLDSGDNNFALFLTDLITALREVFPNFGAELLDLVNAPLELTAELGLRSLLDAMQRLDRAFALVLDDYHTITSQDVHQVLTGIAAHPPPALHLLLCTRHDPPLPPRIRLSGNVNEVRMQELSFTEQETAEFLERAVTRPFDAHNAPELAQRVEGWPAALRLVAIMAQQGRDIGRVDEAVRASGSQLMDYLASEVINTLAPELQRFVECTAILQRLCGPLCAAVLGAQPGDRNTTAQSAAAQQAAATLRLLEQAGLFLVNIDEAGDWYRYHALFRSLMQERLKRRAGMPAIEELHRRAAAWYEAQDMLDDALQHLLALPDKAEAVALVARHWHKTLLQTDFRHMERWVGLFPPAVVQASPDLLLIHAWLGNYYNDLAAIANFCRRVEEIATQPEESALHRRWLGEAKALCGIRSVLNHDAQGAVETGRRALSLLSPERFYARSSACMALAVGLQMTGQQEELRTFLESLRREPGLQHDLLILRHQQVAGYVHYVAGDLPALRAAGTAVVELGVARRMVASEGWGHYFVGCACYLQNDLAGAYEHFGALTEQRYRFPALAAAHGAFGLALTFQALNLPMQANAALEDAQQYLGLLRSRDLLRVSEALAAELALRQGRLEEAVRWRRQQGVNPPRDILVLLYNAQLADAKILLAQDTAASRRAAAYLLGDFLAKATALHNVRFAIEALVLQARLYAREGDIIAALTALGQALTLAAPGEHLRVFVEGAPALGALLAAYQPPAALAAFTARVRTAVEQADKDSLRTATQSAPATPEWPTSAPMLTIHPDRDLRELLTFREMDVLLLLGRRMTNKEIARELGISIDTVKQHTVNLYRKLGVGNRRQAILYADAVNGPNQAVKADAR